MDKIIHPNQRNIFHDAYRHAQRRILDARKPASILIAENHPISFLGTLSACLKLDTPIFLGNPLWRTSEWEQVSNQITPDVIFGQIPLLPVGKKALNQKKFKNTLMIPTGGTGGRIRFAIHTRESLRQSAQATIQFLDNNPVNSYCALPAYHISGLMPFVRALYSGGQIAFLNLKKFQSGETPLSLSNATLSLVPTQLKRLLEYKHCINWLKQLNCIFIGGAPATNKLLEQARKHNIPLAPTYGLTETASMITALHPHEFLQGHNNVGKSLSHAQISIKKSNSEHKGNIHIQATSLFQGYFPEKVKITSLATQDEGYFDPHGYFNILGRTDDVIITGGKKVKLWEINDMLLDLNYFENLHLTSLPDDEWGTQIIALYSLKDNSVPISKIKMLLKTKVEAHKIPKRWILVEDIPRTQQGKIDKSAIKALCLKY